MRASASIEIDRGVDAVWAFLADPANNPKWDPGTLAVRQTSDGPMGYGTTFLATVELLGRRDLDVRIVGFDPHRTVGMEFVSGLVAGTQVRYDVESVGVARTRLTRSIDLHLRGAWTVLQPLVGWYARRHRADEIANLKRILESSQ